MGEIEITLKIKTTGPENARFIRRELELLLDCPHEWMSQQISPASDTSFFEAISIKNEMVGNASLKRLSAARWRLPK